MGVKVLLCEDIERLGWLGDVIEVREGYARNYLIPQGLAMVPTEGNIKSLEQEKSKRSEQRMVELTRLEKASVEVEGAEVVLSAKANEQGRLFGSITASDIAGNLRDQGFAVADTVVKLDEHIKEVGSSTVDLKFSDDLRATVTVLVVAQGEPVEVPDSEDVSQEASEPDKTDENE